MAKLFGMLLESERESPQALIAMKLTRILDPRHAAKCTTFLVVVTFVTALCWAKARDPFRLINFSLKTQSGGRVRGTAIWPKSTGPHPVAVYLYGSNGRLADNLNHLRQFAELGMAGVCIEYDQGNYADFDQQFSALCHYLSYQPWVRGGAISWIGSSMGAQNMLSFLLRHRELQPQLLIRLSGGWVPELDAFSNTTTRASAFPIRCPVLLVHGELDERFPVAEMHQVADLLRSNGVSVVVRILPGTSHKYEDDRALVVRLTGEYCKSVLAPTEHPVYASGNYVEPHRGYLGFIAIAFVAWVVFTIRGLRTRKDGGKTTLTKWERRFRCLAAAVALLALAETLLHVFMPVLAINATTLSMARHFLVPAKQREDFLRLASESFWARQRLNTLLQHVELANYNRELVEWKMEDQIYWDYVLSPRIDSSRMGDMSWRRPLWEALYPRVRNQANEVSAAKVVVRFLRERISIMARRLEYQGTTTAWNEGLTDPAGFEVIYVAALRSVGIPARLNGSGNAEICSEGRWIYAPRPLASSFLPATF
jgi:dienelactone hydrolase